MYVCIPDLSILSRYDDYYDLFRLLETEKLHSACNILSHSFNVSIGRTKYALMSLLTMDITHNFNNNSALLTFRKLKHNPGRKLKHNPGLKGSVIGNDEYLLPHHM